MVKLKFMPLLVAVFLIGTALTAFAVDPMRFDKDPTEVEGVLVCLTCELAGRTGAEAQNVFLPGHTHALKLADGRIMVFVAPVTEVQALLDQHKLNLKKVKVKGFAATTPDPVSLFSPQSIHALY